MDRSGRRRGSPGRRGKWSGPALLAAVLAAALISDCGGGGPGGGNGVPADGPGGAAELRALVTRVVDGDTIEVRLEDGSRERVRYIGVDTPESVKPDSPVECFGPRASEVNERLVGGRPVRLRFDAERRDRYGRLLAYVYAGNTFVNAELVRRGAARTLTIAPNDSFAPLLARLEARAGRAGRGLWGVC